MSVQPAHFSNSYRKAEAGPIPKDWELVRLSEVLTQRANKEEVLANHEYRRLGARWYGGGPFKKDTVSGSRIKAKYLYQVCKDDFIYNRLFAWKGSFGVVSDEFAGGYVSN